MNPTVSPKSSIGNFEITRVQELPELQCTLIEATHKSGASVMHLACDDDENLFCLSFRTYPDKSDGVAHILEHTVLCGSERFPIRDPFFGMTRRSLNTFMNALTGADFTCYPASSCIPKDFYNLLDVYLDAVFHPRLLKLSFLQEGHRLEYSKREDPATPLAYKGVVFNEMKGAMHSPDSRLIEAVMSGLFPDLTYSVNSGGDPKVIPTLTYDKLKAFHEIYYHPSRCLFFFYGNLPLEKHLEYLEEKALNNVKKKEPLPLLSKQKRFSASIHKKDYYPIADTESVQDKTLIALSWLTCSILEQEEVLALGVIDLVLMGTDAAPLKMALLHSNLCKAADSFLEAELSEIPFTFILRGCAEDSGDAIESFLRSTLTQIVQHGLPKHLVDGAIHQLEFSRSEITGNSSPFGLSLFMRSALLKQHGGKPEEGLLIHSLFEKLRKNVEDETYLPKLIGKHLLDNPHFVRVDLLPSHTLAQKETQEERIKLDLINQSLSDEEKRMLVKQAQNLIHSQEDPEEQNFDILPKVTLSDVPKKAKDFPLVREMCGPLEVFHHPCFTNGIVYVNLAFDLPLITQEELPLLRLFSLFLTQMGCGGRSYNQTLEELLMHTGGIGASLDLCLQAEDPTKMRPCLFLKGKSLFRKMDRLFPLLVDYIERTDFTDQQRLQELLMQHLHGLEESVHQGSLRLAVNLAGSGLSMPAKIMNAWFGLDYYYAVKKIASAFATNPASLIDKFEDLKKRCLGTHGGHLILSTDEKSYAKLKENAFFGLDQMVAKPFTPWKTDYPFSPVPSQGRITASPVAFTAWLFKAPHYLHPAAPALYVISEIMENKTLHKRIREQGGAYGSGAINGSMSGSFYFYAYRDPHLASTLIAIEEAVLKICDGAFDEDAIEEAKLEVFQELDAPVPPKARAITSYARFRSGRTLETRQAFREKLFALGKEELIDVAKQYLATGLKKGTVVTFAGKELLEKENAHLQDKALPLFPIDT